MALAGFPASAVRAGIMSILYFLGLAVGRESDSLNSLGFALLVMTAGNPYAVNDVGLLLSACATLGLLLLGPRMEAAFVAPLRERKDVFRFLARRLASAAAVSPVRHHSHAAGDGPSLWRNLLVAPFIQSAGGGPAMAMMLTGCGAVICLLLPGLSFLSEGLLLAAGGLSRYLLAVAQWLGSLPLSTVRMTKSIKSCGSGRPSLSPG